MSVEITEDSETTEAESCQRDDSFEKGVMEHRSMYAHEKAFLFKYMCLSQNKNSAGLKPTLFCMKY